MNHGRSYGLCKKIVAVGKMGKEQMLEKFDVLVLSGGFHFIRSLYVNNQFNII